MAVSRGQAWEAGAALPGCPQGIPSVSFNLPRPGLAGKPPAENYSSRHCAEHALLMVFALWTFLPEKIGGKRPELTEKTQFPPGNLLYRQ